MKRIAKWLTIVLGMALTAATASAADFVSATNALVTTVLKTPLKTAALSGTRSPIAAAEWQLVAPIAEGDFDLPYDTCWVFQVDSEPSALSLTRERTLVVMASDLSVFVTYTCSVPAALRRKADGEPRQLEMLNDDDIPREVAPRTAVTRGALAKTVAPLANTENNTNLFVVLISGGADKANNGIRFYLDVKNAYQTLKEKCNVPRENIFTFVASGVESSKEHNAGYRYVAVDYDLDGDGTKDVNGGAYWTTITNCLHGLSARLTDRDRLLIVLSTHGSRYDETDFSSWETLAWLWNEYVFDGEFRNETDEFACPVAFALQQCFSGGFADDIVQTENRVVGTAANHLESSWGYAGASGYNLYLHNFFAAVADGSAVNFYDAALAAYNGENLLAHPQYAESTAHLGCDFRFDSQLPPETTYETVSFYTGDDNDVCLMPSVDYRPDCKFDWMPDAFSTVGFHDGWTKVDDTSCEAIWLSCATMDNTAIYGLEGAIAAEIPAGGSRKVRWTAPKGGMVAFSLDGSSGTGSLTVEQSGEQVASEEASGASWPSVCFWAEKDVTYTITMSPSSGSLMLARLGWCVSELFVDAADGDDDNDGLTRETAKLTIQAAIDQAADGTTIRVAAGRYAPIASGNKTIAIVSDDGAEATVIDGGWMECCADLTGDYSDDYDTILTGFTLENGYASGDTPYGAGLRGGTAAQCVIRGCVCSGTETCGAATCFGILTDCLIYGNMSISSGDVYGGACYGTDLYNCTVADNVVHASDGTVRGGGLYSFYQYGYGYGFAVNSIVVGTSVEAASTNGVNVYNLEAVTWFAYAKTRTGGDPKFVDRANGDYRLASDSPCIDAGYSDQIGEDVDLAGNARVQGGDVDQGCYESAYTAPTPVVPTVTPTRGGRHYGVFVGINEFAQISSLSGCILDARNMRERCLKSGLWHDEDTAVFTNSFATESAVRAAIADYAAVAQPGDTFIYVQSSHGGNDVGEKMDAFLCMYDYGAGTDGKDGAYRDSELANDLLQFPEGVRVLVYVDACRSGGLFQSWDSTDVAENDFTLLGAAANVSAAVASGMTEKWNFALRVRSAMTECSAVPLVASASSARVASGTHVSASIATNVAFVTAADYDQYSFDIGEGIGGAFTAAFVEGWATGDADADEDGRLNVYELYDYAASIATGEWMWVSYRTEAQCDNAALLAAILAGYTPGTWPEPEISSTDTPAEQAAKVQDAMIGAGFPASTAAVVTNAADYAYLQSWSDERGYAPSEVAASPVALLSPALGADGLLTDLTSNDVKLVSLAHSASGTTWQLSLSITDYEATKVNESLLKAAVGVVGGRDLNSSFTTDELAVSVRKGDDGVELTVTPPADATNFFLRAFVR